MKNVLVVVCLLLVAIARAEDKEPKRRCGRALTDFLGELCQNIYNEPKLKKSSDIRFFKHEPNEELLDVLYDVYRASVRPRGPYQRLYKRGIVDDCCFKTCTPQELMLYCSK
ncbi:hypothetical protein ABEB36_006497 [Hypothenemus hampei]|uniref:Insulin-like domain-containing protein n=1 Tax=Hypothenemus hampei TaxID=57062 RepID=A0ABD1ER77_HYPHA